MISAVLEDSLLEAIKDQFKGQDIHRVEISSVEIDELEEKIIISVEIATTAKPESLARQYFGLTGKVRKALGPEFTNFFPIINPAFVDCAHA